MKIKSATFNNFAKYSKVTVNFDENVTYLIGRNGSGKSTIGITGVQAIMQGIAEKATAGTNPVFGERFRFIGPNSATSKNELVFIDEKNGNAEIKVSRKITKTGSELSIEAPDSYGKLDQDWLNNLFNIFLIAPKRFTELNPVEQAKALGINTKPHDDAIAALKQEFTGINRDLKQYAGLVEVEKTERVDLTALQQEKEQFRGMLNKLYLDNKKVNDDAKKDWESEKEKIFKEVSQFNEGQSNLTLKYNACFDALSKLQVNGYTGKEVDEFLEAIKSEMQPLKNAALLYPTEPEYIEEKPDDTELQDIDQKILTASQTNEKAFAYEQYLIKKTEKEAKENELNDNKKKQTDKEGERLKYIKSFKLPFSNLSIGEDGELLLDGKPVKEPYFSTGELIKLIPILISSRNPELKYVFLQDFNLLDPEKQAEVEEYLTSKGFQLVIEYVGKEVITEKNCILLKDNIIVESYSEETQNALVA